MKPRDPQPPQSPTRRSPPRVRLVRGLFAAYAVALFIATHWPKLTVPGPEGSDKLIHVLVFGTWCILATLCCWFAPPLSTRNILASWLLAIAYAGVDESLQAFSFVHRSAEWADFFANSTGITLATIIILLARHPLSRLLTERAAT